MEGLSVENSETEQESNDKHDSIIHESINSKNDEKLSYAEIVKGK